MPRRAGRKVQGHGRAPELGTSRSDPTGRGLWNSFHAAHQEGCHQSFQPRNTETSFRQIIQARCTYFQNEKYTVPFLKGMVVSPCSEPHSGAHSTAQEPVQPSARAPMSAQGPTVPPPRSHLLLVTVGPVSVGGIFTWLR